MSLFDAMKKIIGVSDNNKTLRLPYKGLYDSDLEQLIDIAISDGDLSEKEMLILTNKAKSKGIDADEFNMVLDATLKAITQVEVSYSNQSTSKSKVHKCPACGSILDSFTIKCPECGYELRDTTANATISDLLRKLDTITLKYKNQNLKKKVVNLLTFSDSEQDMIQEKASVIDTFVVPNNKEDILEFLSIAVERGKPISEKEYYFSDRYDMETYELHTHWRSKCEQVIMKSRILFKEDSVMLELLKGHSKKLQLETMEEKKKGLFRF